MLPARVCVERGTRDDVAVLSAQGISITFCLDGERLQEIARSGFEGMTWIPEEELKAMRKRAYAILQGRRRRKRAAQQQCSLPLIEPVA